MKPLSKAILALVASGAGALALAMAFIEPEEGLSLTSYQDVVGVWTICNGSTTGVRPGQTATPEECRALLETEVGQYLAGVYRIIPTTTPAPVAASVTSLCYNVGLKTCRPVLDRIAAGRLSAACEAIRLYVYAGGKNCRKAGSGCAGIAARRDREAELCRLGL